MGIDPYLADLRPAQREVFEQEFLRQGGEECFDEKQNLLQQPPPQGPSGDGVAASGSSGARPSAKSASAKSKSSSRQPPATHHDEGTHNNAAPVDPGNIINNIDPNLNRASEETVRGKNFHPTEEDSVAATPQNIVDNAAPFDQVEGPDPTTNPDPNHLEGAVLCPPIQDVNDDPAIDPFQCQFCKLQDESLTVEGLDLHYW